MTGEFVPKKTITIQLSLELYEKLRQILVGTGMTKTKLLAKMIENEYQKMEG